MSGGIDRKFDTWYWSDSNEAVDQTYNFEVRITRPENMAKEADTDPIEYYIKTDDPPISDGRLWWRWRKTDRNGDQYAHRGSILEHNGNLGGADWDPVYTTDKKGKEEQQAIRRSRRRVVDDTPANRAALVAIQDGLVELAKRLDRLLAANVIQETLVNVSTTHLLSLERNAPPPEAVGSFTRAGVTCHEHTGGELEETSGGSWVRTCTICKTEYKG